MALCHADAMQIILFCMADFLVGNLWQCVYWTFGAPGEIRTPDPQIRSLRLPHPAIGRALSSRRAPNGTAKRYPAGYLVYWTKAFRDLVFRTRP